MSKFDIKKFKTLIEEFMSKYEFTKPKYLIDLGVSDKMRKEIKKFNNE